MLPMTSCQLRSNIARTRSGRSLSLPPKPPKLNTWNTPIEAIQSIRQRDYEGYLCVPFYPSHLRNVQYALRAFNVELASIRENVSNPTAGKMRMQFWSDTINNIYKVCYLSISMMMIMIREVTGYLLG